MSDYIATEFDLASTEFLSEYEEIVRCRDCKNGHEHDMRAYGGDRNQLLCHHFSMSSSAGWPVEPNGFCAWGERETINKTGDIVTHDSDSKAGRMSEYIYAWGDPLAHIDGEITLARKEIVRCRDCIYYKQDPDPIDPGWPMMCERTGDDMVEPYGFCAWGERRE